MKKTITHTFIAFTLYFLLGISSGLNSQTIDKRNRLELIYDDIQSSVKGSFHVFTNPVRWEKNDWFYFGGTIAGGALLFTVDEEIDHFFKKRTNPTLDDLSDFGTFYGGSITLVVLTGSIYAYGLLFKDEWARETVVLLTSSLVSSGLIQTISAMAGRARPYTGFGESRFEPFASPEGFQSFVSGHALVSVSLSHILAKRVNNVYLKSLFYTLGGIGVWARIYDRTHFSSDVFLGGVLGYAAVTAAMNWHQSSSTPEKKEKVNYSFSFGLNKVALNIYF
jgi:membrane-associated phospholipid phosphatase